MHIWVLQSERGALFSQPVGEKKKEFSIEELRQDGRVNVSLGLAVVLGTAFQKPTACVHCVSENRERNVLNKYLL